MAMSRLQLHIAAGYATLWELADYLGGTEDLKQKTVFEEVLAYREFHLFHTPFHTKKRPRKAVTFRGQNMRKKS